MPSEAAPRRPAAAASAAAPTLAERVVHWQRSHGRSQLPWQNTQDPYRVWLSEVMLQQTQVSTVQDYYTRFLARFPTVEVLAAAFEDEVLGLWSGLGYYRRARYLHACAQQVMSRFGGQFPRSAAELVSLPGIGRSTAAAIAAFCYGERVAILDGNVQRVLTRVLGWGDDLSKAVHERALWEVATSLLPPADRPTDIASYTQGLMDLGATVCMPRNPSCLLCPLAEVCVARREGAPERYPVKTRKVRRTAESLWVLHASDAQGRVWLEKRPSKGIWAGLYALPVFPSREAMLQVLADAGPATGLQEAPSFVHVLTHKDLHLHPVSVGLPADTGLAPHGRWMAPHEWPVLGLPTPMRHLLERHASAEMLSNS